MASFDRTKNNVLSGTTSNFKGYEVRFKPKYQIITILFLLIILSSILYSAPRYFVPITLTQPNGEVINCFASGDEFYNWVHDKDNYTIIKDSKTGYYVYALKSGDELISSGYVVGKTNPASAGIEKGINISGNKMAELKEAFLKKNNMGNSILKSAAGFSSINNIVIFIRFSDEAEFTGNDKISKYDSIFNSTTAVSLYNYYQEASYKKLALTTTFYPKTTDLVLSYQDSHPRSYYKPYDSATAKDGYPSTGSERTNREMQLLNDAVNFVKSEIPTDLNIDMNNDGYVDNVCFIVSGTTTAWNTLLWPHRWTLSTKQVTINNKRVWDFNFQIRSMADVGTLCHEMFHTLGAPDLYHYTNQGAIQPFGVWDIMDNGIAHMCAYMKMKYGGWISDIPTISDPGTYTLSSLVSSQNCAYKIKSQVSDTEFFVVEYRRVAGLYEGKLPGHGLLIYRINTNHKGNASGPPDEVYLYRPGGTMTANGTQANANFSQTVGRTVFNNSTDPVCFMSDGSKGDLNITSVAAPVNTSKSSSTISFVLGAPIVPVKEYKVASGTYSWIDISKTGTKITNWKNGNLKGTAPWDDGYTPTALPLGFSFTFFGEKYDSIYAGINGLASFTKKVLNSAALLAKPEDTNGFYSDSFTWPGNTAFPNSIALAYADFDLIPTDEFGGGSVYYATQNNKFILSYENIGSYYNTKGDTTNSFQLILDKTSNLVTIQIKKIGLDDTRSKIKIGIQKNNTNGLSWVNSGDPAGRIPADNSCIVFSPINTSGINENRSDKISGYILDQNYPNPFNPSTTISYYIPYNSHVTMKLYDILGREVNTLLNETKSTGSYKINLNGMHLSSGIYFYTLKASSIDGKQSYMSMKKMILMK
jgi:M6 family metalloprotease-like protein